MHKEPYYFENEGQLEDEPRGKYFQSQCHLPMRVKIRIFFIKNEVKLTALIIHMEWLEIGIVFADSLIFSACEYPSSKCCSNSNDLSFSFAMGSNFLLISSIKNDFPDPHLTNQRKCQSKYRNNYSEE